MKPLIYDIEIVRAIPNRDGSRIDGIEYCGGWHDHASMGISVIGAYDYDTDRYRVFCRDNFMEFVALSCQPDRLMVGFNNIAFDDKVIVLNMPVSTSAPRYDLLVETWAAVGLGPTFDYKTHGGYGLDALCELNFGTKKTGNGALAPVAWQQGKIGDVIDYCLNDVRLTKQLFERAIAGEAIKTPKGGSALTFLRRPE